MMESELPAPEQAAARAAVRERARLKWLWDVLLIGILLVGFYFRSVGLNWDQNQHLHPDERFLTMVETSISPVKSLAQYFDTATSTLNPNNQGYGFYVYGTLPLFWVRYVGEWLGKTGYDEINLVGRQLSAFMDLGVVLVVYLIAARLYSKRWLAWLAAAFAAFSVLPIQLSHYFTVDTFTNFFGMLALYFAVLLLPLGARKPEAKALPAVPADAGTDVQETVDADTADIETAQPEQPARDLGLHWIKGDWRTAIPYILFGTALGLAMACKINAALLAVLLPGAVAVRFFSQTPEERERWTAIYLRNMVMAAVVSVIIFRIFQPYAFDGPGFFNMMPSQKWLDSLRDLSAQSTGDVDFPPALQWARRPITFALQNMVVWGLGLPLGILAWAGFLWMGYRILKGEWRQHLLIWVWTGVYFAYQSYNFTRAMRYQMLVYPTLAIIAAWAVAALWDKRGKAARFPWARVGAVAVGLAVLGLTAAWAFAFTRIYTRPVTRVAASRWIYQNVPGPINLRIDTGGSSITNQPVAYRSGYTLSATDGPTVIAFRPTQAGVLTQVSFEHLVSSEIDRAALALSVSDTPDGKNVLTNALLAEEFRAEDDPRGKSYTVNFDLPLQLDPAKTYYLILSLPGTQQGLSMAGPLTLTILRGQDAIHQALPEPVEALAAGKWYQTTFTAARSGFLNEVLLDHVVDWQGLPQAKTLRVSVRDAEGSTVLGAADLRGAFAAQKDPRGESYTVKFAQPVELRADRTYSLRLEQVDGPGNLAIYGSKQANESSWDDALPVGLDGYNPYDYSTGIYRSDLNFEMYWDDNAEKLQRFESTLDQADYIFISSNRQWGTTTRVPERYPLTSEYYRQLLGCPADKEITWCYSVAQPGMFKGGLGYDLVSVFQSDPNLGSLRFNTQFAEEAFTVYDAPKVLIFKKTAAYDSNRMRQILGAVDLSNVIHVTPRKASSYPGNLMLPPDRLTGQRAGGTWADLFHPDALYNRYPGLAAALWYVVIALLGWTVYPFTRLALRGLPDRGYPLARMVGMLVLAYVVWLLGSAGIPFSTLTISAVFAGLLLVNMAIAYQQRHILASELRERWKYIVMVELLFLAFFLLFLFVRLGNPDLWHPYKGGEKPMDFSYFNAVLKSTTFPPYDPWFAGGYINYYYYGFVIAGVPVKWLGIEPEIAYNLILPLFFALLAAGAFSVGWNLLASTRRRLISRPGEPVFDAQSPFERRAPFFAGLAAAVGTVIIGNWGTVRMIWHGLQRLADTHGIPFEQAGFITRIIWTFEGLGRILFEKGTALPYGPGDWYWIPSRAIPGEPITEFPAFTFLYGDPHAHLIALPVTVLALAWALSILLGRWGWKGWDHLGASFLLGGLAIGALRPTNTWDWPTYLALGCVAVIYTALRYGQACCLPLPGVSVKWKKIIIAAVGVVVLAALSTLLYQPYVHWYGQGYNQIDPWKGDHTPFWSYMTHWSVFLFVIVSWLATETIDWMASTPLSSLNKLRGYQWLIQLAVILVVALTGALLLMHVGIAWVALPLAAWAGALLLRPGLPDAKRAVLFMTGTALFLTLFVEVAVLRGDIGRMNTVFKFYLQAWTLLAASAGASLIWLLPALESSWRPVLRSIWEPVMALLVAGALLFPVMAGMDKMNDRMSDAAPHTLDGMAYMATSTYNQGGTDLDLSEDYRAIQWMQRNVPGSPVIVEGNTPQYYWGSRFTIYTGLPGVVGWEWHQIQQRGGITSSEWVTDRVAAVNMFYNATDRAQAEDFLRKYDVKYIVVGQLEEALYHPAGLRKFNQWNGSLWREVYRDGRTAIYAVNQPLAAK